MALTRRRRRDPKAIVTFDFQLMMTFGTSLLTLWRVRQHKTPVRGRRHLLQDQRRPIEGSQVILSTSLAHSHKVPLTHVIHIIRRVYPFLCVWLWRSFVMRDIPYRRRGNSTTAPLRIFV